MYLISKRSLLILAMSFATLAGVYSCSSSKSSSPTYDIAAKLSEGWSAFTADNYDLAIATFTDVLSHSSQNLEAHIGRGWSYAFKKQYTPAINDLTAAISQSSAADAHMGLCAIYRDLPDLQNAITNASAVIEADSDYVFTRMTSVDFKDAHLIKAQCYYRLGKSSFPAAHIEVNYLCSLVGLAVLPSPGTLTAAEYEKQLGHKLEELSQIVG